MNLKELQILRKIICTSNMITLDFYPSASQFQKCPSVYNSDSCMTTLQFNRNQSTCACNMCSCLFSTVLCEIFFLQPRGFTFVIIEMDYCVNEFVSWRTFYCMDLTLLWYHEKSYVNSTMGSIWPHCKKRDHTYPSFPRISWLSPSCSSSESDSLALI